MAIKPKSRAHEDRLQRLETDLATVLDALSQDFRERGGVIERTRPGWIAYCIPVSPRKSVWQRLNDYFSR